MNIKILLDVDVDIDYAESVGGNRTALAEDIVGRLMLNEVGTVNAYEVMRTPDGTYAKGKLIDA